MPLIIIAIALIILLTTLNTPLNFLRARLPFWLL